MDTSSQRNPAFRRTYNDNKKLMSLEYLDAEGNPVFSQSAGYSAVTYDYDRFGNKIRESYFNSKMESWAPLKLGYATATWEYSDNNKLLSFRYYNKKGELVITSKGYAGYENRYSEDGLTVLTVYMDAKWKVRGRSKTMLYSMVRSTYNEAGKLIREEYLDAGGNPTYNSSGIYARILEYDSKNRLIREGYLGDKGQLYSGKKKYAVTEYYYDEI